MLFEIANLFYYYFRPNKTLLTVVACSLAKGAASRSEVVCLNA
ncbi:hypothetical protein [Phocaeicola oris]|nr:hypothetical protein [Phocaeicola oris]